MRAPVHRASECLIDGVLRFEKNDILRIVRALAIFRPSLIALQMPLTEEDEIFVEKCVQRSVIVSSNEHCGRASSDRGQPQELNKLISYSGTPTVVWRRTGEICLVGPEFSMLTEWSKEELLGTKKYIWEVSNQLSPLRNVETLMSWLASSFSRTSRLSNTGKISPPMHSRIQRNQLIPIVFY